MTECQLPDGSVRSVDLESPVGQDRHRAILDHANRLIEDSAAYTTTVGRIAEASGYDCDTVAAHIAAAWWQYFTDTSGTIETWVVEVDGE